MKLIMTLMLISSSAWAQFAFDHRRSLTPDYVQFFQKRFWTYLQQDVPLSKHLSAADKKVISEFMKTNDRFSEDGVRRWSYCLFYQKSRFHHDELMIREKGKERLFGDSTKVGKVDLSKSTEIQSDKFEERPYPTSVQADVAKFRLEFNLNPSSYRELDRGNLSICYP